MSTDMMTCDLPSIPVCDAALRATVGPKDGPFALVFDDTTHPDVVSGAADGTREIVMTAHSLRDIRGCAEEYRLTTGSLDYFGIVRFVGE